MNETTFVFGEWSGSVAFNVEVPSGIRSKKELLRLLGASLNFPDYYGVNWDAFEECIRDLSWLPDGNVVIKHNDLPVENDEDSVQTYLAILRDAVAKWSDCEERNLISVFPIQLKSRVMSAVTES